jgi:hypothetical protein
MDTKIIVFSDTNKIFALYRAVSLWSDLSKSSLLADCHIIWATVAISGFVLIELKRNCIKKWISWSQKYVDLMIQYTGFIVYQTKPFDSIYLDFVEDIDDAQIVQDAVEIWADYLLTNNTKDYKIPKIYQHFKLWVISDLSQIG